MKDILWHYKIGIKIVQEKQAAQRQSLQITWIAFTQLPPSQYAFSQLSFLTLTSQGKQIYALTYQRACGQMFKCQSEHLAWLWSQKVASHVGSRQRGGDWWLMRAELWAKAKHAVAHDGWPAEIQTPNMNMIPITVYVDKPQCVVWSRAPILTWENDYTLKYGTGYWKHLSRY